MFSVLCNERAFTIKTSNENTDTLTGFLIIRTENVGNPKASKNNRWKNNFTGVVFITWKLILEKFDQQSKYVSSDNKRNRLTDGIQILHLI